MNCVGDKFESILSNSLIKAIQQALPAVCRGIKNGEQENAFRKNCKCKKE